MKRDSEALTAEEMFALESNAEYLGISLLQLMECAGKAVADKVAEKAKEKVCTVFAGAGRNGGDGMVASRYLASKGFKVYFYLIGVEEKIVDENVRLNWSILKRLKNSVEINIISDSNLIPSKVPSKIVVDAMLGIGVKGKLKPPILDAVKTLNKLNCFIVSIDTPTGLDASTGEVLGEAVKASLTVTFHKPKIGLLKAKEYTGEIYVADIGIPLEAEIYTGPGDVKKVVKPRPSSAHKGSFGRLLIIGGSKTFTGAPALAGLAALRVGVDLVYIAAPEKTARIIASYSPNLITIKLEGEFLNPKNLDELKPYLDKATAIVVGPGLETRSETFKTVFEILKIAEEKFLPVLLDADGVKAYSQFKDKVKGKLVLTPHRGEYKMLSNIDLTGILEDDGKQVMDTAKKLGCTLIVKGPVDIVSDGFKVKFNWTGNPGMTVGGTGDILAGIVGGFLAQGVAPYEAAVAGIFVNGAAGDLAVNERGYHIVPTDLLDKIPTILENPRIHKDIPYGKPR